MKQNFFLWNFKVKIKVSYSQTKGMTTIRPSKAFRIKNPDILINNSSDYPQRATKRNYVSTTKYPY